MNEAAYKRSVFGEEYPRNLLLVVEYEVKDRHIDFKVGELTEDILDGVEHALGMLSEREQLVIRMRYKERKKFTEISEALGVDKSRAGVIERKAIHRLCRVPMLGYLKYGKKTYDERVRVYEEEKMKQGYSEETLNTPIADLGLSPHLMNALRYANCVTVGDAVKLTEEELVNVPYLKRSTGRDIAYKLRELGALHTSWERFYDANFITAYEQKKKMPKINRDKVRALIAESLHNMANDPDGMTEEEIERNFGALTTEKGLDVMVELLTAIAQGKAKK